MCLQKRILAGYWLIRRFEQFIQFLFLESGRERGKWGRGEKGRWKRRGIEGEVEKMRERERESLRLVSFFGSE